MESVESVILITATTASKTTSAESVNSGIRRLETNVSQSARIARNVLDQENVESASWVTKTSTVNAFFVTLIIARPVT